MNKLSIPSKKEILRILNEYNLFFSKYLSQLNINNLKNTSKYLIYDRRFIITSIIVILTLFAHLSTPAFYQDKWVLNKIKKQLEKEYNLNFLLPEKVSYSMFPVPSFYLNDVGFSKDGRQLGEIKKMVINLTFNKFLNKDKINIQAIHISNSKFEIQDIDILNFINFFKKKINEKKLFIKKSIIFLKNNDEVYSIISLNNSTSFFDKETNLNILNLDSNIFSNRIKIKIKNDFKNKIFNQEIFFSDLNAKVTNTISYKKNINTGIISENTFGKGNKVFYEFNDKFLNFRSEKKFNNKSLFESSVILNPFDLNLDINLNSVNLNNFVNLNGLIINLINTDLLFNEKLNYKISLFAKNISNYRKLQNLNLLVNYTKEDFSLKNSNITLEDIFEISILENNFQNDDNNKFININLLFKVLDQNQMYKFFQTKKNLRKKIDLIEMKIKFNLLNGLYNIEDLKIDGKSNQNIFSLLNEFNMDKNFKMKQVFIKKYFNKMIGYYNG